ncbi:MAG: YceI family protein [Crocinitomicaceae bacterium]|nr:YceI family protein [Crocinitomicaceae bacterium]
MKKMKLLTPLFIILTYISFAQDLPTWSADVAHSNMGFKVSHKAISNTIGDFRDFDLVVTTPNDNFEDAKIKMIIETASINTANSSRDEHLRSEDFFDAERYPQIIFTSSSITAKNDNTYDVKGTLNMHGVEKELILNMTHNGSTTSRSGSELAGLYFSTIFKRSDFKIGVDMPNTVVADDILLNAEIEIVKQ